MSPDGREVRAGQRMGGDVAVIDTESLTVKATVRTGAVDRGPAPLHTRRQTDPSHPLPPRPADRPLRVHTQGTGDTGGRRGPRRNWLVEPSGLDCAFVPLAGEGKVAIIDLESRSLVGSIDTGREVSDGMAWVPGPQEAPPRNTRP